MSQTLGEYLEHELRRRGWSRRTLAMYANISPDTAARLVRGESDHDPETIKKVAKALDVSESLLLRLAGYLDEPTQRLTDAGAIDIARRIESLPPRSRDRATRALQAVLDWFGSVHVEYSVMERELRRRYPEIAAEIDRLQDEEGRRKGDSQDDDKPPHPPV